LSFFSDIGAFSCCTRSKIASHLLPDQQCQVAKKWLLGKLFRKILFFHGFVVANEFPQGWHGSCK
jgi:hypothetical protein